MKWLPDETSLTEMSASRAEDVSKLKEHFLGPKKKQQHLSNDFSDKMSF